ncbi:Helix-turn-helix domain-containing protein [Halovenus aranensis]|jgi:predicted transcriptional regulator|uniref:Helix-turn-helix domain-containing protein n=1 Tax=Halovenus aranensis TaxID=890420 RepID=A0A1G8S6F0_9EURY|nr:winged helix-turn-helix domain-containing protein [Halovenus aranensis]SDJ24762.1 Helix-turn-helix domain-containing protein [Halovenus aranensis]
MASSRRSVRPTEALDETVTVRGSAAESLLELLGDEYTQRVLAALGEDPMTGSELIDRADVSKATAYRRLDDLQEADIVESTLHVDPDGHHCEQYSLAVSDMAVSLGSDGFEVEFDVGAPDTAGERSVHGFIHADD